MKNEYNVNKEEIISWSKGYLIRSALGITWICLYVILFFDRCCFDYFACAGRW